MICRTTVTPANLDRTVSHNAEVDAALDRLVDGDEAELRGGNTTDVCIDVKGGLVASLSGPQQPVADPHGIATHTVNLTFPVTDLRFTGFCFRCRVAVSEE